MQALNHTYELNNMLDNIKYVSNDKSIIVDEWNELRKLMWKQDAIVSPQKFVTNVHKIARSKNKELFTGWSQNDMPEFLMFMIECIHEAISRKVTITIAGIKENPTDEIAEKCYKMIQDEYAKDYSEILDLFYGIHISEITSINGLTKHSIKPESFFIMNLPVPNIQNVSLYDCFDLFTSNEVLTGENAWFNEKTNQKEDINKRITFWNFPKILIIVLKRFSADGRYKNHKLITCPLDNLDLSRYVSGYNPISYKYDLYAVCNHMGSVYGGHYTSFVKNYANEWIHYNDSSVNRLQESDSIITPMTYCLFYRKKNKPI